MNHKQSSQHPVSYKPKLVSSPVQPNEVGVSAQTLGNPINGHRKQSTTAVTRTKQSRAQKPQAKLRLQRGHFAFMRAIVQGVDPKQSWEKYLSFEGRCADVRNLRGTISWIRDEFAAAARRHSRHGLARLVMIDPAKVKETQPRVSLSQFVEERGLDGFSEAEQLEAYQSEYGGISSKQSRRARLIAKQLAALQWLEELTVEAPQQDDSVEYWLNREIAQRLQAVGIHTLGRLAERINGKGKNWSRGIPAIGPIKSQRIVDWMQAHQDITGLQIGTHVLIKRTQLSRQDLEAVVPRGVAVVPINKLSLPPQLDGRYGQNRKPVTQCLLSATNDVEAILNWLGSKQGSIESGMNLVEAKPSNYAIKPNEVYEYLQYLSHTQRAYLKEAERLLLWSVVECRKPLSSLTSDDCRAYLAFLAKPDPKHRWCGPRVNARWSPLWRPFEGPVSPSGQARAISILKNLFSYLVDQGYLLENPWTSIAVSTALKAARVGRCPSPVNASILETERLRVPDSCAGRRMQFALSLMNATGLSVTKLVQLRTDNLICREEMDGRPDKKYELRVTSNRGRTRQIVVPTDVIRLLNRYLEQRGFMPDPTHPSNQGVYLIGRATDVEKQAPWSPEHIRRTDNKAGISAATLTKELRRINER